MKTDYKLKLVIFAFVLGAGLPLANAQIPGDVDGDGLLSLRDAYRLEQYVLTGAARSARASMSAALFMTMDANSDGTLDVYDAEYVRANLPENTYQENTIVLDGSSDWELVEKTTFSLTLDWHGTGPPPIDFGSVVYRESPPTFMRYVLNVERDGARVVCSTRDATLNEVFVNANFSIVIRLSDMDLSPQSAVARGGVLSGDIVYPPWDESALKIDKSVSGTGSVLNGDLKVTAKAEVQAEVRLLVEWSLEFNKDPFLRVRIKGDFLADLTAIVEAYLKVNESWEFYIDSPILIAGAPLDIPGIGGLTLRVIAICDIEGNIDFYIQKGMKYEQKNISLGFVIDKPSWEGVLPDLTLYPKLIYPTVSKDCLEVRPAVMNIEGKLEATVTALCGLNFKVVGIGDVFAGVGPYARMEVAFTNLESRSFDVYAGVTSRVTLDVEAGIGLFTVKYNKSLPDPPKPIWEYNTPLLSGRYGEANGDANGNGYIDFIELMGAANSFRSPTARASSSVDRNWNGYVDFIELMGIANSFRRTERVD